MLFILILIELQLNFIASEQRIRMWSKI